MPRERDHIILANKNHEALLYLLDKPDHFSEWITTVAFYKAVHIVEAVFCHESGHHCFSHSSRLDRLKNRYRDIFCHYRPLWGASTTARYLHDKNTDTPYTSFQDYMPPGTVERRMVKNRLSPVEQLAVKHLSKGANSLLKRIPP